MKTRVQKWLPVITGLMFSMHALAYDFESGGIYYNYKEFSDSEVYVTHNGTPYSGNSYSGHVKIPKTVTYNSKMYRVTEIGQQAFKSCKKLISVEIPESVTKIGNGAFDYSGLSSVNIPNSVTIIENNAFSSTQLTSIRIPGNATQWERAFAGCSKLTTVIIESGIKKIEKGAFANCTGLTSVSIPNSVTVISESAFSSCTALTSIDIPNSVTEISSTAFSGCNHLVSLKLGTGVTDIFYGAFRAAPLKEIYASSTIPPIAYHTNSYTDTFDADIFNQCTLHVPAGSLQAYKNAEVWKNFKNIVENDFTGIERPSPNKAKIFGNKNSIAFRNIEPDTDISIYDTTGKCIKTFAVDGDCEIPFPSGIYLIKYAGRTVKIIL